MVFEYKGYMKMKNPNGKELLYAQRTPKFPPKVAYTLLEIAKDLSQNKSALYDPFCGNGTILTIAGLNFEKQFKHLFGSDIDSEAVDSTRLNLATFTNLSDQEILAQTSSIDCTSEFPANLIGSTTTIVSDPPFGKRCSLPKGTLEKAFANFANQEISDLTFCFDDKISLPTGISEHYQIKKVLSRWDRDFYIAQRK